MKAIGYVKCSVCNSRLRGYPPRGWKDGEQLCCFAHGQGVNCAGSYKPGTDTHLDSEVPR